MRPYRVPDDPIVVNAGTPFPAISDNLKQGPLYLQEPVNATKMRRTHELYDLKKDALARMVDLKYGTPGKFWETSLVGYRLLPYSSGGWYLDIIYAPMPYH